MQHINIKIFAGESTGFRMADAIPVFHRWIQDGVLPELLIDVADYAHVPAGPGVVLIAHEANYSLDNARNRLGLLYNRKLAGDHGGLRQAFESALDACRRLEEEPEFQGRLKFNPGRIELTLNDRLLHPNTEAGWQTIQPETTQFFDERLGVGKYTARRVSSDPRERLTVAVEQT